ncbi:hypothetical protein FQZ97_793540 [compost metagenome]
MARRRDYRHCRRRCAGLIASGRYGLDQRRQRHRPSRHPNPRRLAGQIHRGRQYAGHLQEGLLDTPDARGTGHAGDGQIQFVFLHAIARIHHRLEQGCQCPVGLKFDRSDLAGEVDVGGSNARHANQGLFDTCHTGRASHARHTQRPLLDGTGRLGSSDIRERIGHGQPPTTFVCV